MNELVSNSLCNKRDSETGARCGEAWQLKWIDFDFENKTVRITPEKGSEPRRLRISDKLIAMLNNLPKDRPEPFPTIWIAAAVVIVTQLWKAEN